MDDRQKRIENYYRQLLRNICDNEDGDMAFNELVKFVKILRKNFDSINLDNCLMYHILAGSSIAPGHEVFTDLEGEYSIIVFIEELKHKYIKEK